MIDYVGFKNWLRENTKFSDSVISDISSRLKRANSFKNLSNFTDFDLYIFYLEKDDEFLKLSVSVKSQLRKAIKLYATYINTTTQK